MTETDVDAIAFFLHENYQFFDAEGHPANGKVLEDIETLLKSNLAKITRLVRELK